jgi:hypothetical protein
VEPQKTLRSPPFSSIGCKQVPPYILYVTIFMYRNFGFDRISGNILWRIYGNAALGQTTDLIMAMHSRFKTGFLLSLPTSQGARSANSASRRGM